MFDLILSGMMCATHYSSISNEIGYNIGSFECQLSFRPSLRGMIFVKTYLCFFNYILSRNKLVFFLLNSKTLCPVLTPRTQF